MAIAGPSAGGEKMKDLGLFTLRLTAGGLMAGHGTQKLFGCFGGHGLEGTGGWLESMGLRPGKRWALAAGLGEFGGGLLTTLGLFHPVGPLTMLAPMAVAAKKVHGDKPIWVTEGGAELPVTNMAIGLGLAMIGPGAFSLDRLLGIKLPKPLVALAVLAIAGGTAAALTNQPLEAPEILPEPAMESQPAQTPASRSTMSGEATQADRVDAEPQRVGA
jgi:putative oxidoreductase